MKISEIVDIQTDVTDKISKAKALCDEFLDNYCVFETADPDSKDVEERLRAYTLCARYPTWSLMLYCALDMISEAEKLAWKVTDALDNIRFAEFDQEQAAKARAKLN